MPIFLNIILQVTFGNVNMDLDIQTAPLGYTVLGNPVVLTVLGIVFGLALLIAGTVFLCYWSCNRARTRGGKHFDSENLIRVYIIHHCVQVVQIIDLDYAGDLNIYL